MWLLGQVFSESFETDLSRGFEGVPISVVLPSSGKTLPNFQYIKTSRVFDKAAVFPRLKLLGPDVRCHGCAKDCLDAQEVCSCAEETRGQFAYTKEGLLKDEFLNKVISDFRVLDLL